MPRSKKKGPFIVFSLIKKVAAMREATIKRPIKTYARAATILPEMEGLSFQVHMGNGFESVHITADKIGHKLGEFAQTRKFRGHKVKDAKAKGGRR